MELLFGIAILVAVGAVVAKKLRTGPRTKEDATPRVVSSYRAVDDTLPRKCGCGGRFEKISCCNWLRCKKNGGGAEWLRFYLAEGVI